MKRSILICLFSLMFLVRLWPNEQPEWLSLLQALRLERQRIVNCLSLVEEELTAIETAYAELAKQHGMMQRELNVSKEALRQREKQLGEEQKRLQEEKAQSEKLELELTESASSLTNLKITCEKTLQDAEAAIAARDTWIAVALIGIPVAIVIGVVGTITVTLIIH